MTPKIIIIPGNGNSHIESDHWYAWARDELKGLGFEVIAEDMPDPEIAHMHIWLPHLQNVFKADGNTVVIGHSSGAVAALRYLEQHRLLGIVAIGANYTDLGYPEEPESGYYGQPWHWQQIKAHAGWIVQFCSQDDPYIPIREPRFIHEQLDSEYHEFTDRGHFGSEFIQEKTFPELLEVIRRKTGTH